MFSNNNINSGSCDGVFVVIFFKNMYNKTIIRFRFCDILNNQGFGKCYQLRPLAWLITLTLTLIIPDITKTSANHCLLLTHSRLNCLQFSPHFSKKIWPSKGMSSKRNENCERKAKRAGKRESQWFKSKGSVLCKPQSYMYVCVPSSHLMRPLHQFRIFVVHFVLACTVSQDFAFNTCPRLRS